MDKDKDQKPIPNWKQRVKFGLLLASSFSLIIYIGPLGIILTFLAIQIACYWEILTIGYNIQKKVELPYFRLTSWYFLILAHYYLCGELINHFKGAIDTHVNIHTFFKYHRFYSFCCYFAAIIVFVINLKGKYDVKKFRLLALTHLLLLGLATSCYMLIRCVFIGMIWAVVPIILVILNDVFAYVFGKFLGKTPLIQVSPNKTWEGFLGGAFGTVISAFVLTSILCPFDHFVCPRTLDNLGLGASVTCNRSYLFIPQTTTVLGFSYSYYPFLIDSFVLALFASIIAPFGGFYCSGFKRAFNLKDFSNIIPGHGGIMDRFDCQYLMAFFVYVYVYTFVQNTKVDKFYARVLRLPDEKQLEFFNLLKDNLKDHNMILE